MEAAHQSTTVLVVGGGPSGLTAALLLASRNIPAMVVERHGDSSVHPRAIGFTVRSLEIYRSLGLGDEIPQIPPGMGKPRRITVESLAGKWHEELFWSAEQAAANTDPDESVRKALKVSPCTGAGIAQDRLEPILRNKAAELGADIRIRTELISFTQDTAGVVATVRNRDSGEEYSISAKYMIAADGHASPVREALGIGRQGQGYLSTVRSVLFRADLDKYLEAGISQFDIAQPDFTARLVTYRDGRWALMFEDDEERDEDTLRKLVSRAIGDPKVEVELITTGRWELSALIADRFSQGRIFLAGDAAHTFPPARGGFGANTGIEDVHNLVWKLEAVLSGTSQPGLLETYDTERRAIAWLRHGQIFNRDDYAKFAKPGDNDVPVYDDEGMELGQLYRSAAVLGAGEDLPPAQAPEKWAGQPGTRAPHLWVWKDGKRVSTLDLVLGWSLLTTDPRWRPVVGLVAGALRIKLTCTLIGAEAAPANTGAAAMSLDTPIEEIMAVPEGKALLEAQIPEIAGHSDYARFKSMSLTKLQPLAAKQLTPDRLAKVEAGLAGLETTAPAMMSLGTPIEQILANPKGRAVIDAHIPEIPNHAEYARFKSMSLRQLQPMAAKQLTDERLAKVEAGLADIPSAPDPAQVADPAVVRAEFCEAFGIGSNGASLIRPDGYVAWRSVDLPPDALLKLTEALASVAATTAKP